MIQLINFTKITKIIVIDTEFQISSRKPNKNEMLSPRGPHEIKIRKQDELLARGDGSIRSILCNWFLILFRKGFFNPIGLKSSSHSSWHTSRQCDSALRKMDVVQYTKEATLLLNLYVFAIILDELVYELKIKCSDILELIFWKAYFDECLAERFNGIKVVRLDFVAEGGEKSIEHGEVILNRNIFWESIHISHFEVLTANQFHELSGIVSVFDYRPDFQPTHTKNLFEFLLGYLKIKTGLNHFFINHLFGWFFDHRFTNSFTRVI